MERAMTEAADLGAKERLEPAELDHGGLLVATHLHRYELAAGLCSGLRVLDLCCGVGYGSRRLARDAASVHGVDLAEDAIATARATLSEDERGRITFETGDALAYLRSLPQDRFDAVVCFEGLEHVPEPAGVVDELARLAEGGARVIVSLPNSRGFEEDNQFHVTDFGFEEMRAVAERLGDAIVLGQYLAEASLVRPADERDGAELRGTLLGDADPGAAWANHWLLLAGVDPAAVDGAHARLELTAAANHNAYMRQLEHANAELIRANNRLARRWLGVHDAAAAVIVRRLEERVDKAVARAEAREADAGRWEEIANNNDWARVQLEKRLSQPRYRMVDAVRDRIVSLPGGRLVRSAWARRSGGPDRPPDG